VEKNHAWEGQFQPGMEVIHRQTPVLKELVWVARQVEELCKPFWSYLGSRWQTERS